MKGEAMKAKEILQAFLDNDLLPIREDSGYKHIFRAGEFLCATNGHGCLCLKSDLVIPDSEIKKSVSSTIEKWLALKSKGMSIDLAALKSFIGPRRAALSKCDLCDEWGYVICDHKGGTHFDCELCEEDAERQCDCGYEPIPVDPVLIGKTGFNRNLLALLLENIHGDIAKCRPSSYLGKPGTNETDMMILGMGDWRVFVMPVRTTYSRKTHPYFDLKPAVIASAHGEIIASRAVAK